MWKLTDWLMWTYGTDMTNTSCTGLLDLAALDRDRDALRRRGLTTRPWSEVRGPDDRVVVLVGRWTGVAVHTVVARSSASDPAG